MGMILYGSPAFVKELLHEMDKEVYDKIVRDFAAEASAGLGGQLKGALSLVLDVQGDIEGSFTKNESVTKEITNLERDLRLNHILEKDERKLRGHLDTDFNSILTHGLYSFSGKCHLRERYEKNREPQI